MYWCPMSIQASAADCASSYLSTSRRQLDTWAAVDLTAAKFELVFQFSENKCLSTSGTWLSAGRKWNLGDNISING
jgi:hypothetical protein